MVAHNINIVKEKIAESCARAGRNPSDVKIIAVSKNTGLTQIKEAVNAGITELGENKAKELSEKSDLINNVNWHFIGHLQRNKIKYVIKPASYIHSVDSLKLAEEINELAAKYGKKTKVLLEVNTSGEESKYGIKDITELVQIALLCNNLSNLDLQGLMTMAPYTDDEKLIRKCFSDLRKLSITLNEQGIKLTELSMGMSNDYEIAVQEGATMLRLGTVLFGERDYSSNWRDL